MVRARTLRARNDSADHWPGFVDALATLLLVAIFLLSLFAVAQYASTALLSSRDEELARVNAQLSELADALALERAKTDQFETRIATLQLSLETSESEKAALQGELDDSDRRVLILTAELEGTQELTQAAQDQVAVLNEQILALREQLAALNEALEASEARDREQEAQIESLSERLNAALAQKVQQLAQFRSRFFEELTQALGDRADVRVVGDRFVFETDVLFGSGSADLSAEGREQLRTIADVVADIADDIPDDVDWIIRVDGHTDRRPIATAEFASNWELSAARAISVVNYFEALGVPSRRLVAAGFGEHYPVSAGRSAAALAANRRIELKLDSR